MECRRNKKLVEYEGCNIRFVKSRVEERETKRKVLGCEEQSRRLIASDSTFQT
jgi:hypothetical protein